MNSNPALILDLDGTLIRNDLTYELFVLCARWNPLFLFLVAFTAITNRSKAKRLLSKRFSPHIDPQALPYEPDVLKLAQTFRQRGHAVELVSGSDEQLVGAIARHTDIEFYKGSSLETNLTASRKAQFLVERHGANFLYVGNSKSDSSVWLAGRGGYAVNAPARSYRLTDKNGSRIGVKELVAQRSEIGPLLKSLRLHQWTKNLLILVVPAIQIVNLDQLDWLKLLSAFLCFSMLASATYILNDLFDIPDDRRHPTKKHRPLASGLLSIPTAIGFVAVILPVSLYASFLVDWIFGWVLVAYLFVTVLYSLRLKRLAIIDVFTLASLFSLRVIAGAYVVGYPPSAWLLTFVGCFFLSLAIGKRFIEILALGDNSDVPGRGYRAGDEISLLASGSAIGMMAVLAMLIYGLSAPITVFNSEMVVLAGCALLVAWMLRFWLLAGRREISEDPVIYAIRDKTSILLLSAIFMVFAQDLTSPLWINAF